MTNRVKDKVALVTGAANGIGAATAKLLAQEGAMVVVADINEERGQKVVEEILKNNGKACFVFLDVTNETAWEEVLSHVTKSYKQLNILVNNAGISMSKTVIETSLKDWRHLMAVNLDSVFLGTKHAIKHIRETKNGSIVNVSSVSGLVGIPRSSAYCSSKAGIGLFTKTAALECAEMKHPIRVNSVCPAAVKTPHWEEAEWWPRIVEEMGSSEAVWKAEGKKLPIGRVAVSNEIATGILFLASDEASFITGTELVIDGGFTAQ